MSFVSLDTQLVIWGIRKVATQGQEAKLALAENLLKVIDREKMKVHLASIVLAEACSAVPEDRVADFILSVQKQCAIIPFDTLAALWFQKLHKAHYAKMPTWRNDEGYTRINILTDMKILATALSRKDHIFYTDNMRHFVKIANGFDIEIRKPPEILPEQLELPIQ